MISEVRVMVLPMLGFPCGLAGKESACNAGDLGLIPGLGRSPGEGNSSHLSILAWRILWTVHGVAKSRTPLSNFHFSLSMLQVKTPFRDIYSKLF